MESMYNLNGIRHVTSKEEIGHQIGVLFLSSSV